MMHNNYRCDICNSSMATTKRYVSLKTSVVELDTCEGCLEVMDEEDLRIVALFIITRHKARLLRNMPKKDWIDAMEGDK